MSFSVYILFSTKLNKYYVGCSEDVDKRLNEQHNAGRNTSTKAGIPWILKYTEIFATRREALQRERSIKNKKSRKYIEMLISSVG